MYNNSFILYLQQYYELLFVRIYVLNLEKQY